MTKNVFSAILLLLSCYSAYSQEQTPAIEWIEPYYGGTRGGSITLSPGPNTLFALIKGQNTNSGSASISKFYADGLVKDQYITVEGGSGNVPYMLQCPSQDGGVLAYLSSSHVFKKYDASLNLSWELTDIYFYVQTATATLANGFYIQGYSFTNNRTVTELKRMRSDGSIEWSVDISGFSSTINDIQTSSDDGVIIATANGIRKYNVLGNLIWSNTSVVGASQLIISDPSIMYTFTNSSNPRSVIQLNTSTGNANWTRLLVGESIIDFKRTSDNGCTFSTNTGLYKYNASGELQWRNTDFSSAKIATTGDGKIFVVKNNTVTKLTFANEQLWDRVFNRDFYIVQDIYGASDFGLYITVAKNGANISPVPAFLLFKLASPDTPCKTNFSITGENATFCRTGSLTLSSKISNFSLDYITYLTSFSLQWYKNNTPIASANYSSYTANQTGSYTLKIGQNSCQTTSRNVELNLINETPPIIESEKSRICAGSSVNVIARGCDGTVVWSTGERGPQIKVSPQANTTYNALCERDFNNELCQSYTSNTILIAVTNTSDLKINDIAGKREFCGNGHTQLKSTVSGGVQPLSYVWSKGASLISNSIDVTLTEEGDYIFEVFDNLGCRAQSDIITIKSISLPSPPVINQPVSNILCANGNIMLTTDAKENSYQWIRDNAEIKNAVNSSYSVTNPGTYLLKATNANGCYRISTEPVAIFASDLLIDFIIGKTEFCSGDSTELDPIVMGSARPFKYEWARNDTIFSQNNKLLIKESGNYVLNVTDKAGCSSRSNPLKIHKTANPIAPVITSPTGTEICVGGKAVLTTTAKENNYQWYLDSKEIIGANDQFYTATASGKYELKVKNVSGCMSKSENAITITQIIIPQPTIRQSDDSLISSAATGNKWYFNTAELPLTSQKIKFTEVGNYQVKVFEKGCESIISVNFIPIILANEQEALHIQVYPNPTSDIVFIKSSKAFSYQLVDVLGRLLKQSTDKSFSHTIDINGFSSGNYFVILQEENGNNFVRKLSVNQ